MSTEPPRLRHWLQLIRVQNLPTALADVWAGFAIGAMVYLKGHLVLGSLLSPSSGVSDIWRDSFLWRLLWTSVSGVCLYAGGVALNDYADHERDRALWPHRPIPSGAVSPQQALLGGVLLLAVGGAFALRGGASLVLALGLISSILAYDFLFKSDPALGSLSLGLARAGNWLLGLSVVTLGSELRDEGAYPWIRWFWRQYYDMTSLPNPLALSDVLFSGGVWILPLLAALYAGAITLASTTEEGRTGNRRLSTALFLLIPLPVAIHLFSLRLGVRWGSQTYVPFFWPADPPATDLLALKAGWGLSVGLSLLLAWAGFKALASTDPTALHRLIVIAVRGYVVLDAIAVMAWGSPQAAGAILGLLVLSMLLGMKFRGS